MKDSQTICIIGGFDLLSKSFFAELKKYDKGSIFLNVNNKKIDIKNVYNVKIYQLKKIIKILHMHNISNIIFLGKINRPNLSEFKNDGLIEKYIPYLINSYKKGDGNILSSVVNIFKKQGFKVISPKSSICNDVSNNFFLDSNEFDTNYLNVDKIDINKSVNILNDLSKYDNAQSIVSVNGYVLAIEAAEGTDKLLRRVISIRKQLKQIKFKAGLLIKMPKQNQSKLVDLPVIGPQTINLIYQANLKGIAVSSKFTMIYKKVKTISLLERYGLKLYGI